MEIRHLQEKRMYDKPDWIYNVFGVDATLTRGIFHESKTGKWIGCNWLIAPKDIKILIQNCTQCNPGRFWVTAEELTSAEDCIECEYCSKLLYPVSLFDNDLDLQSLTGVN